MSSITDEFDEHSARDDLDVELPSGTYETVRLDEYSDPSPPPNSSLINPSRHVSRNYEEPGLLRRLYNSARNSTIVVKVLGAPSPYSQRRSGGNGNGGGSPELPVMNEAEAKGSQRGFFIIGIIIFVTVGVIALMVMVWK